MFNLETIIALLIIAATAKLFDYFGYRRCFAEICNTYEIDADKLTNEMKKHNKNEEI